MQDDIPKQRGIYSEILTTEDTENLKVSLIHLLQLIISPPLARIDDRA